MLGWDLRMCVLPMRDQTLKSGHTACFLQCVCCVDVLPAPMQACAEGGTAWLKLRNVDLAALSDVCSVLQPQRGRLSWRAATPEEQHSGFKLATRKVWFMPVQGFVKKQACTAHLGVT